MDSRETNKLLFHWRIILHQMSQPGSPCHISSHVMTWFKEKVKHYTEGKHAIPTLRGVLAKQHLPQQGVTVCFLHCTQPAIHVSPDGRVHSAPFNMTQLFQWKT